MTRKARRKQLSRQSSAVRRRGMTPWVTWGALLAGAALASPQPASAAIRELRADPRLSLIHDALQGPSRTRLATNRRSAADAAQEQVAAQESKNFNIPAGPLSTVAAAFEAATGLSLVPSSPSMGAITSPGVSGTMSVEQALAAITDGTSLTFRFTTSNTVSLEFRVDSQSVDVTGRAPTAVVSSPKYVTPLREVPQTITV